MPEAFKYHGDKINLPPYTPHPNVSESPIIRMRIVLSGLAYSYSASLNFNTVSQARVSFRTGMRYGEDQSGAWQRSFNVSLNFRGGEKFEARIGPSFEQSHATAQYVTSRTDQTAIRTFGRRYLFADLDQSTLSMDARFNVTLTPRATIEIFAQPLLSSVLATETPLSISGFVANPP